MNQFDQEDRRASAALDKALADAVVFRPMKPKRGGNAIVIERGKNTAAYAVDPDREARPRPGETGFVAIVTWRSYFLGISDIDSTKRDVMAANDVMLDFDRRLFKTSSGEKLPETGDVFELKAEDGHTIVVQQSREPFDDGGVRIALFCIAPA